MVIRTYTTVLHGLDVHQVEVEIEISPGLPAMVIVGLPDKSVQESKERIRSGIRQSGYEFPLGKVTVNLAPADLAKSGSGFDCAIAIGILMSSGAMKSTLDGKTIILGELALDGSVRSVPGVLPSCLWARENGYTRVIIPSSNAEEVSLVGGIEIIGIQNMTQLIGFVNKEWKGEKIQPSSIEELINNSLQRPTDADFAYVKGQSTAKRALEIAACGGHNVLMIGEPGSGKTMLARAFPTILPPMTEGEVLEVSQVYSISNQHYRAGLVVNRPFRSPHHSASHVALVGGGSRLLPGEISLAHRGVLFLDEFPEFFRESIEALRQPLEDGVVSISRATGRVLYPARFILIAAANPTPSGYWSGDSKGQSNISAIKRYQAKFSGPIIDRIDLHVEVDRPLLEHLKNQELEESSIAIRQRVIAGREIQRQRFTNENIVTNSEMSAKNIKLWCRLDPEGQKLLDNAVEKLGLSARGYHRMLKLARTIADLAQHENIEVADIAESLQYRQRQRLMA